MKTRYLVAIILGIVISGGFVFVYAQMYDCLHPPIWVKIPRTHGLGDCLQMYADGTLPHYTNPQKFLDTKIGSEFDLPSAKITEIKDGNKVIISGSIGDPINTKLVTIFVKNQDNELLQVAQVAPDEDGQFSYNIDVNGPVWEKTTKYFVEINYNGLKSVIGGDWGKENEN